MPLNKSEFARLAGVSKTAIGKACSGILKPAFDGKLIDEHHPVAVAYIENKQTVAPAPVPVGVDPLYQQAVDVCTAASRWSITFIQKELRVGYNRAAKIMNQLKATDQVPVAGMKESPAPERNVPATSAKPEPKIDGRKNTTHVRGTKAAQAKMKAGSMPFNLPGDESDEEYRNPLQGIPEDIRKLADWSLREILVRFGSDTRLKDFLDGLKKIEDIHEKRLKNAEKEGELIHRNVVKTNFIDTVNTSNKRFLSDGTRAAAVRIDAMSKSGTTIQAIEDVIADQFTSFMKPAKDKMARVLRNI